ncbi:nucleotidyltransferase domain-containing protein [Anaerosporobacter faecicola]|uniref:nucleotidyltransferase domain-containing protein n=1 Tax=Anaerosporobacter faecicola TaxID=2718714 RepID=UPI0014398F9E|nr:nucleotidyltransferase domain-containing protein [Anaerosporobacter faecicola]
MKTYEAIDRIGKAIIEDGLCEAIVLKGSIGRGDDDAYSDIDMYVVVAKEKYSVFMDRRLSYLKTYGEIVYCTENDFGVKQMLAIYENALHIDLYTTTMEQIDHNNPVKVYYDPKQLFAGYEVKHQPYTEEDLVKLFDDSLYYFVEADSAYARKNYPWTAHILSAAIAGSVKLMRNRYDPDYAYLGLKKINEILPMEEYELVEEAYANLNKEGFQKANQCILDMLELVLSDMKEEVRNACNLKFFAWCKKNVNVTLFI